MQPPSQITEFRICLPMTVEEYHIAQLWSVAEASKNETGGGEGLEVVVNEPFSPENWAPPEPLIAGGKEYTHGQYTKKIYHLKSKVPTFIRLLAPKGALEIYEDAWNAYPYCRTVISNPDYMKENFYIVIESFHAPDRGDTENIHEMKSEELSKRKVCEIDIANPHGVSSKDYKPEWDPSIVKSEKSGRGPLSPAGAKEGAHGQWSRSHEPVMCCYKVVRALFKWWGLQSKVEKLIMKQERRLFTNFHRQVFCWMDKWYGLTIEDIRRIEARTKEELDEKRQHGELQGLKVDD